MQKKIIMNRKIILERSSKMNEKEKNKIAG